MTNHRIIENQLNELLSLVNSVLSESQRKDIQMFINASEWGLALETICEFLYEDELPLSEKAYELCEGIGMSMNLDTSNWDVLRTQVV
ncbi:MAG: MafI family immunity protein [Anaerolineae bacterium]|nr:MafI family immunity protein [Anaerolineae bacterium]